ncbi:MAG: phosphate/phosphite/phosphonate ABC transporter substrate-binding protein [Hyphomicrobiales bacterium]|nr:phosphate/phosphite/phosphonate ABC transporter substrate-binding protein [Hyphomicrobiales bacterium]
MVVTRRRFGLGIAATASVGIPAFWTRQTFGTNNSSPDENGEKEPSPSYTLGVFPFLPALTLDRVFAPIVRELNAGTQGTVYFRTKPDFDIFLKEVLAGRYDFVFVHPFLYVDAAAHAGYRPLVRVKSPLTAVITTTTDSPLQSIRDLHGKTLALPPQLAAVSEMLKGDIVDANQRLPADITFRHYLSKSSCIQALAIGKADACGLPRFALSQISGRLVPKLRVIHETQPVASLTFATHPRVDKTVHTQLRTNLLRWQTTEEGQRILKERGWSGLIEAQDQDFDVAREYRSRMTALLGPEARHVP